jgi:hypothetical protein
VEWQTVLRGASFEMTGWGTRWLSFYAVEAAADDAEAGVVAMSGTFSGVDEKGAVA